MTSSEGKTDVVTPISAPMFAMVARSGTLKVATPSPPYSSTTPTLPVVVRRESMLEDHVLRRDPVGEPAREAHQIDPGTGQKEGAAPHGDRDVEAARADGDLAEAAARGRVAVGAQERGPRLAEALQMDLVADAVSRPRIDDAEPGGRALEIEVVVVVLKADLERIVVHVADREVGLDPAEAQGLELEKGHRARGVLGEGLIDADADRLSRRIRAFFQVRPQHFFNDVFPHFRPPADA